MNWVHDLFETAGDAPRAGHAGSGRRATTRRSRPRRLDAARRDMGELQFAQEHLAQFVTAGAGLFKPEWLEHRYDLLSPETYRIGGCARAARRRAASVRHRRPRHVHEDDGGLLGDRRVRRDERRTDARPRRRPRATRGTGPRAGHAPREGAVEPARALGREVRLPALDPPAGGARRSAGARAPARPRQGRRALPATAALEQGRVLLPRNALWLRDFETEILRFPEGVHDDQVDAWPTRSRC